jgi:hypothetical protein
MMFSTNLKQKIVEKLIKIEKTCQIEMASCVNMGCVLGERSILTGQQDGFAINVKKEEE